MREGIKKNLALTFLLVLNVQKLQYIHAILVHIDSSKIIFTFGWQETRFLVLRHQAFSDANETSNHKTQLPVCG